MYMHIHTQHAHVHVVVVCCCCCACVQLNPYLPLLWQVRLLRVIGGGGYSTTVLGELEGSHVAVKLFARSAYKDDKEVRATDGRLDEALCSLRLQG